jgi:hypothetical protein
MIRRTAATSKGEIIKSVFRKLRTQALFYARWLTTAASTAVDDEMTELAEVATNTKGLALRQGVAIALKRSRD